MRIIGKKSFILTGVPNGGFMFVADTIWDVYRKNSLSQRTTSYAFDIILNLLIWPSVGYVAGLICWKLIGESDRQPPAP